MNFMGGAAHMSPEKGGALVSKSRYSVFQTNSTEAMFAL